MIVFHSIISKFIGLAFVVEMKKCAALTMLVFCINFGVVIGHGLNNNAGSEKFDILANNYINGAGYYIMNIGYGSVEYFKCDIFQWMQFISLISIQFFLFFYMITNCGRNHQQAVEAQEQLDIGVEDNEELDIGINDNYGAVLYEKRQLKYFYKNVRCGLHYKNGKFYSRCFTYTEAVRVGVHAYNLYPTEANRVYTKHDGDVIVSMLLELNMNMSPIDDIINPGKTVPDPNTLYRINENKRRQVATESEGAFIAATS